MGTTYVFPSGDLLKMIDYEFSSRFIYHLYNHVGCILHIDYS